MGFRRSTTFASTRRTISVGALLAFAVWLVAPGAASAGDFHRVGVLDRCDPATFNAMFGDGVCTMRNAGVPVDTFLERVNPKDGGHNAWRFTPGQVRLHGQFLRIDNRGGETHTFTEVAEFGGGTLVPALNAALPPNTPVAEPIGDLRFIRPGQEIDLSVPAGTHKFECMIHPWMRTTVTQAPR